MKKQTGEDQRTGSMLSKSGGHKVVEIDAYR
jgi:hypothetical protein